MNANEEWRALDVRIHNQASNMRRALRNRGDAIRDANRARFTFVRFRVRWLLSELREELTGERT